MTGIESAAYSQREHAEFMREQEREEERAYRRAGLPSPALARPKPQPAGAPAAKPVPTTQATEVDEC